MFKGQPTSHKNSLIFKRNCLRLIDCSSSLTNTSTANIKLIFVLNSIVTFSSRILCNTNNRPLTFLYLLLTISNAYGLSSSTANEINGNKPYLLLSDGVTKLTNLDELLGFKMPKRDGASGSEWIDTQMAGTVLMAPVGMKYSDVEPLIIVDGSLHTPSGLIVGDEDGDADIVENTNVTGKMKATWYNAGVVVPASDLGQTLLSCGGPYTLNIEIPNEVNVNTKYGTPNSNAYGTHAGLTYTFMSSKASICYLQPASMKVNSGSVLATSLSSKFPYQSELNPGGYNPITWKYDNITGIHKGFKVTAGFPTTGFKRAEFSIIGSGNNQQHYRCSSLDNGGKITLSGNGNSELGTNCKVTYNSITKADFTAGGTTPTITMEYNLNGNDWVEIGKYTIPNPVRWAIGKGELKYGNTNSLANSTQFAVLDACRNVANGSTTWQQAGGLNDADKLFRQAFLYRRDELTNSSMADRTKKPEGMAVDRVSNYYSRDVDGTFMGEWGYMFDYKGSGWSAQTLYWTAESWSPIYQFYVDMRGLVGVAHPKVSGSVAICRGE